VGSITPAASTWPTRSRSVGSNLLINLLQATGSHASTAGATDSIAFDWDFGANYHVNLDAGVVRCQWTEQRGTHRRHRR
jgi:hypothetical protein